MTNRELVSRIANGFNTNNRDVRIPKRYILNLAVNKAIFYMSQKFRDRSLFREMNLYKMIECVELVKIDKFQCDIVEFRSCNSVMKSKKKLPKLVYSRYGSSVKEVTNIDFSESFKSTDPVRFRLDSKREGSKKLNYYYIKDGYLYLPESEVSRVTISLYTPNSYEAEKISCGSEGKCLNPWDFEFIVSDKLSEVIINDVRNEISLRLNIPVDENPNMDSNQKSKTVV